MRRRSLLAAAASTAGLAALGCPPTGSQKPTGTPAPNSGGGADNKNRTWLTAFSLGDRAALANGPVSVRDSIDRPYQSRWYSVKGLEAGDDITVTLQMPDEIERDYTLLGFVDIRRIAEKLVRNATTSAAPTPSPTAGTTASGGTLDADDMDSDDMDSDDMDSDDMDSDDMDSDDMDSDDMDSDDMDSDDMDSDDMDSDDMDGGERERFRDVYGSAQRHALRSASVTPGPADEEIHMIQRAGGDTLYFRVRGSKGAFAEGKLFTITASVKKDEFCTGGSHQPVEPELPSAIADALGKQEAIILTYSSRSSLARQTGDQFDQSLKDLETDVNGVVIDIAAEGQYANLKALYSAWDGDKRCVAAANAIVESIRLLFRQIVARASTIRYLVIAGADDVIPFARIEDRAEISREWAWAGPYDAKQPLGASLTFGTYLTDDPYGRLRRRTFDKSDPWGRLHEALDARGRGIRAPTLAIGRLVETGDDIAKHIKLFHNGGKTGITVHKALLSGYTFVGDLAANIKTALANANVTVDYDLRFDPGTTDPGTKWGKNDLEDKLLPNPSRPAGYYRGPYHLIAAQGHYSGNSLLPADEGLRLRTSSAAIALNDLNGALWMTIGCHSAHSIVDGQARADLDPERMKSWAETLLKQGATLIGGTAYQYAESEKPENSERLYWYLAQVIASSQDPRSTTDSQKVKTIGEALLSAKRRYLRTRGQVRGIDQKLVDVATIYGLPMLKIGVPKPRPISESEPTLIPTGSSVLNDSVTQRTVKLAYSFEPAPESRGSKGQVWHIDKEDELIVRPLRPILPGVFRDISQSSEFPVGVVWTGGSYDEKAFNPLISEPATEEKAKKPKYDSRAYLPARPFRVARGGRQAGTDVRQYTLVFAPMQYSKRAESARRWFAPAFTINYANVRGTDKSALRDAPRIRDPKVENGTASVTLYHHGAQNETLQAYASYLDTSQNKLVTVALDGPATSTEVPTVFPVKVLWKRDFSATLQDKSVTPATAAPANARVFFQAVGGNGRVSSHTNGGLLFPAGTAGATATTLTLTATQTTVGYRSKVQLTAQLRRKVGGATVDGEILFRLGGSRIWKKTSSGDATAQLTVNVLPRRQVKYRAVASFLGDTTNAPSAGRVAVEVTKASTRFDLVPGVVPPPTPTPMNVVTLSRTGRVAVGTLVGTDRFIPLRDRPLVLRRGAKIYLAYTETSDSNPGRLLLEPADIGMTRSGNDELEIWFEEDPRYFASEAKSEGQSPARKVIKVVLP